jgi:predicted Zn-dependent protease
VRELEEAAVTWASVARACGDDSAARDAQAWLVSLVPSTRLAVDRAPAAPERTLPIHRHPFLDAPPLLAAAIARAEGGDPDEATLACQEILAAAPTYAPGHYCLGRAAEAARDRSGAFRGYREFLDRWSDADEANRMVRDARRRIARVIRDTRDAPPAADAAPR